MAPQHGGAGGMASWKGNRGGSTSQRTSGALALLTFIHEKGLAGCTTVWFGSLPATDCMNLKKGCKESSSDQWRGITMTFTTLAAQEKHR